MNHVPCPASLLTSRLPFYGHDETEVLAQTERQEWRAAVTNCVDISPEAVDLLGAMLALDPAQRITADQILEVHHRALLQLISLKVFEGFPHCFVDKMSAV
jgi:serine/threonine protein kinase